VKSKNSRSWFDENRPLYERVILTPFRQLVSDLADVMISIDPEFEVRPTINKTISRIFRDTRFSRDKSLFRDTMWFIFKRPGPNWSTSIHGFYFEISPAAYRYGMGFYIAAPKIMAAFRDEIDKNPEAFLQTISFLKKDSRFNLEGEKYKRWIPNEHTKAIQDWYQMKTFYLACNQPINDIPFSHHLVNTLLEGFLILKPLYLYLLDIILSIKRKNGSVFNTP
jgi:uncharacterized protein (TIGR02453 family)